METTPATEPSLILPEATPTDNNLGKDSHERLGPPENQEPTDTVQNENTGQVDEHASENLKGKVTQLERFEFSVPLDIEICYLFFIISRATLVLIDPKLFML